jgi:excisionase family DNA binding protein
VTTTEDPLLVTVAEAAILLRRPEQTVRRWIRDHDVPTTKDRKGRRVVRYAHLVVIEKGYRTGSLNAERRACERLRSLFRG